MYTYLLVASSDLVASGKSAATAEAASSARDTSVAASTVRFDRRVMSPPQSGRLRAAARRDPNRILAAPLDRVHCGVGGFEQPLGITGMVGKSGNAAAGGDGGNIDAVAFEHAARLDRRADRVGDAACRRRVGVGQDHHELVTA